MDVIGVGFGRTGTLSLRIALERLGFGPCYHWTTLFEEPERVAHWEQVLAHHERGETPPWERVYAGYRAAVDWPTAAFWREVVDAYPLAKVVLTVRDEHDWYESMSRTIARHVHTGRDAPDARPDEVALADRIIGRRVFDNRLHERDHAIGRHRAHVRAVRAHLAPERLLVLDVREGWAPLCDHLGMAVPGTPFPHVNRSAEFEDMMRPVYRRPRTPAPATPTTPTTPEGEHRAQA
ncbi:sulfotransferase family protein [Embleya sp. AB8]|uniref:sulfotransferase family protein n=1 Tax=Embleya sp. AB8 TaxID=3156304 RepID=UPI003C7438D6